MAMKRTQLPLITNEKTLKMAKLTAWEGKYIVKRYIRCPLTKLYILKGKCLKLKKIFLGSHDRIFISQNIDKDLIL